MNRKSFVFINFIFTIFLIYIILSKYVYLFELVSPSIAFTACAGFTGVIFIIYVNWQRIFRYANKIIADFIAPRSYGSLFTALLTLSMASKLCLTFILNITSITSHPDIQVYVSVAQQLVANGSVHKFSEYCYTYSHMFWFAVFLTPAVRLFGSSQLVLSCYLAVVSTFSLLMFFDLITYRNDKNIAFVVSFFLCVLPSQLLINQFITHEIALLFFLVLAFWLYFRVLPCCSHVVSKVLVHILFILSVLFACLMNAAGIVIVIAFVLLYLFELFGSFSPRAVSVIVLKIIILITAIMFGIRTADSFQLNHSSLSDDYLKGNKILWTLYVGANSRSGAHWSYEDAERFSAYPGDANYDEIHNYQLGILKERYHALLSSPIDMISLLRAKSVSIWSCFNYPIGYANETIKEQAIQQLYRLLYKPLLLIEYMLSFFAAAWCLLLFLKGSWLRQYDAFFFTSQLFLMGTTAMLLMTECNNKYTLAMQPFFWFVCLSHSCAED